MPRYAFSCATCGPFDVWRPVVEAGAPLRCPACGAPAARLFTAPGLARVAAPIRAAREREEKSAHAPEVTRTKTGRPMPIHAHGVGGHRH